MGKSKKPPKTAEKGAAAATIRHETSKELLRHAVFHQGLRWSVLTDEGTLYEGPPQLWFSETVFETGRIELARPKGEGNGWVVFWILDVANAFGGVNKIGGKGQTTRAPARSGSSEDAGKRATIPNRATPAETATSELSNDGRGKGVADDGDGSPVPKGKTTSRPLSPGDEAKLTNRIELVIAAARGLNKHDQSAEVLAELLIEKGKAQRFKKETLKQILLGTYPPMKRRGISGL